VRHAARPHIAIVWHRLDLRKSVRIAPMFIPSNQYAALNQLLEGDIVYVRDFTMAERMQPEQLKHLAIIAHHCYKSFDLTVNCIHRLAERNAVPADSVSRYLAHGSRQ
jgi:hypothetical protein